MYDPFATPPPPGMVSTTAVPQAPAVPSQNNALAALMGKHMRQRGAAGEMQPGMEGQDGWRQDYQQARMDWRGDRPSFDGAMPTDWRAQMQSWRDLRPQRRDYRMGTVAPPAV